MGKSWWAIKEKKMADKIVDLMKAKGKGHTNFKYKENKGEPNSSTLTVEAKRFNPYTGEEETPEITVFAKYQFIGIIERCDKEIAEWTERKANAMAMLENFKED